jgi:hypothetical protein
MECQIEENLKRCPCTYPGCVRKGKCCDCLAYHLSRRELPACCFSADIERTYDRSFKKWIETKNQRKEVKHEDY